MEMARLLQPIEGQAGEYLKQALSSTRGPDSRFVMVSAWAKVTGLSRIWHEIQRFREAGGHVLAIVGIDLQGTSREALEHLIRASDEAYVFHDASTQRSFHPKLYFVANEKEAVVLAGSGNLTQGGLWTNYEMFDVFKLDLADDSDLRLFNSLANQVSELLSDPETAKPLTTELVTELVEGSLVVTEAAAARSATCRRYLGGKVSPFGVRKGLPWAPPPQIPLPTAVSVTEEQTRPAAPEEVPEAETVEVGKTPAEMAARVLVWAVPVSKGRPSQPGLAAKAMADFFGLTESGGGKVRLQHIRPGQPDGEWEVRPLVFPATNRNRRIEVAGLKKVKATPDHRPIIIFQELDGDRFQYLILEPEDDGYQETLDYLDSLPPGRSRPHQIMPREQLLKIWPNYPL